MKHHLPTLSGAPLFAHLDGQANTRSFWSTAFFFSKKWQNPQKLNLMKLINKKTSRILLTLCAFFFLASHMATAKTYTSVRSGDFNDCTVWATMLVEQSGNDVFIIASGHTVTVPRNVKMYLSKLVLTDATSKVILTDATSVLSTTGAGTTLDCSSDYRLSVALESFQSYHMTDASGNLDVNFIARLTGPTGISPIADRDGAEELSYFGNCNGPSSGTGGANRKIVWSPLWWGAKLDYDATGNFHIWFIDVEESDSAGLHDNPTGVDKTITAPGNLLDLSGAYLSGDDLNGLRFDNRRLEAALLTPGADYNITVRAYMDGTYCVSSADGSDVDGKWTWTFRARFEKK